MTLSPYIISACELQKVFNNVAHKFLLGNIMLAIIFHNNIANLIQ